MTIQQLLENAHLDALGMLDADDQAAFERAFAAAPAGVKAQVRAEQARWAEASSFLPDVQPSADLKQKVLDAVSVAMLEGSAGRADDVLEMRPSLRVSRWWRAGAVGMSCAAVLLGAMLVKVTSDLTTISRQVASGKVMDDLTGVRTGGQVLRDTLFAAGTQRIIFQATDAGKAMATPIDASVFVNATWDGPQFYCDSLPEQPGKVYQLVVLNAAGSIASVVRDLPAKAGLMTEGLREMSRGTVLAIVLVKQGGEFNAATDVLMTATI